MRPAALAVLAGGATALGALLLAGATGGPYLTADDLNGWIVVYAAGLLAALVAAPFLLERALRDRRRRRASSTSGSDPEVEDERWEGAALAWGGIAFLLLLVAVPIGLGESFSGTSLVGAAALIAAVEAGLVVATLVAWLLAS